MQWPRDAAGVVILPPVGEDCAACWPRHAEWLAGREAFLSNLDNSHGDESRALGHSALWLLLGLLGFCQHAAQWH